MGIHDLTSLHAGLLTAVASQRGMTVFLLCDDGSAEFEFTRATRDRLLAAGFVEEAIGGAVDVSAPVQLLSLSERQAEVEEIARRILRDIEGGNTSGPDRRVAPLGPELRRADRARARPGRDTALPRGRTAGASEHPWPGRSPFARNSLR